MRCDSVLLRQLRLGPDTVLVFALTGLILALPAALLPFVGASKLGGERISLLLTGVGRLWEGGMRALAVLVFLCGMLLPLMLLATLAILSAPFRGGRAISLSQRCLPVARTLEHWAIPEVQVLAVLVALMKLGSVVTLTIGPGFWCYCGMAASLLIAAYSFDFDLASSPAPTGVVSP